MKLNKKKVRRVIKNIYRHSNTIGIVAIALVVISLSIAALSAGTAAATDGNCNHENCTYSIKVHKTCTKDGVIVLTCSDCGHTEEIVDEAIGHEFGEKILDKLSNRWIVPCKKCGETLHTCPEYGPEMG